MRWITSVRSVQGTGTQLDENMNPIYLSVTMNVNPATKKIQLRYAVIKLTKKQIGSPERRGESDPRWDPFGTDL